MSHAPFIKLWPSLQEFADDLGIRRATAKGHMERGRIPAWDWKRAVEGAQRRGIAEVTYEALADACARPAKTPHQILKNQRPLSRAERCGGDPVAASRVASTLSEEAA